ncbi:NAD-dependent epimerase/dehydratase family protein [Dolichospermum circinale]|uniref:NAD-dependent epimerase/dehydratase family protein n=1 Tax=Dolichospermum circinale TaxID=109265 RepID=UPI00232B947A|nr:NAD-dependent epimerase/dehydratase family protein [Dolichospermum circinale]MDB9456386.1 NAD-dependent epimerase/dehydratase family protein [Dolichospermum circinale CS-541/06]MDB9462983.1 NAD-dependent epimerase/dehydratase family protein [Dolichospermum circinale CS-541/04]
MKTTIIVGGKGFLGSHVCQRFAELGWQVISVGRGNLNPYASVHYNMQLPNDGFSDLIKQSNPELIVNCAGRASVALSMEDPLGDFYANTALVITLLDAIRKFGSDCVFISFSSASVYGNPIALPIKENTPIKPVSSYGYHKYMEELAILEYASLHQIRSATLRIFSAYGERLRRQVIWDLTSKIITSNGKPVKVLGTGDESRDFIHGEDVARAVEIVSSKGELKGEIYNLASGQEISIKQLATKIIELSNKNSQLCFDGLPPSGYALRWCADISKIQELGFCQSVSLDEGLNRVICEAKIKNHPMLLN